MRKRRDAAGACYSDRCMGLLVSNKHLYQVLRRYTARQCQRGGWPTSTGHRSYERMPLLAGDLFGQSKLDLRWAAASGYRHVLHARQRSYLPNHPSMWASTISPLFTLAPHVQQFTYWLLRFVPKVLRFVPRIRFVPNANIAEINRSIWLSV